MSLKPRVKDISEVPESARGFYAEKDGEFTLSVEGMVPKDRLDEFRTKNVELMRERDALTTRYNGVDPDKYRELTEKEAAIRDRKLLEAGKVDELVNERVGGMKSEYEKKLADLTEANQRATTQLENLVIGNGIRDAATKAGVRQTAIEDVLLRGRSLFRMVDGKAIPMEGDKPIYGKSGDPMDIGEWVGGLAEKAPHLFEQSQGSGSKQAQGTSAAMPGGLRRDDHKGFLANLDKIAAGEVKVA